jgi:hypothetical protein
MPDLPALHAAEIAVHVRDELESALKDKGIEFLLVTGEWECMWRQEQ